MNFIKSNEKTIIKLVFAVISACILSLVTVQYRFSSFEFDGINFIRCEILTVVYLFVFLHFIFKVSDIYNFIYKYRWLLGFGVLIFLVVNKIHGSSIGMFNEYVQPEAGNQYIHPVFGSAKAIRSDEWLVSTPGRISTFMDVNPFGKYNTLLRGTDTLNELAVTVGMTGYSLFKYFFVLFGLEYGFSFFWNAPIIFTFLINFELFMIISKKDKLVSLMGTCMLVISPYYAWWSFPNIIMYTSATLVCFYYFVVANSIYKKILYVVGMAFSFAGFVFIMYPAWVVPIGYFAIVIAVCIIVSNWDKIRKFNKYIWFIFFGAMLFSLVLIAGYFKEYFIEYSGYIAETVYPGMRRSAGGPAGELNFIEKLFYFFQQLLYPFKDTGNNSEASTFLSFFPIPFIILIYQCVKDKKKELIKILTVVLGLFYTIYVWVGVPMLVANVTLLSYSTSGRMVDIVGIISIFAFVLAMSRKEEYNNLPWFVSCIIGLGLSFVSVMVCQKRYPDYMNLAYIIIMSVIVVFLVYYMCTKTSPAVKKTACALIVVISVISSLTVNPLMRGFDVVYSKPLAKEIQKISENDDSKWITCGGIVLSSYTVMCGAPTINYTNTYPNLELWRALDPDNMYNEVYNRYAHVEVAFTEEDTSFELVGMDYMLLKLSYKDISKTGAEYVLSYSEMKSNEFVDFELLYNEQGCYIYKMNCL